MKQSGGTLRIDSVVGRGTAMQLWLPRSAEEPTAASIEADVSHVLSDLRETRPSILLIDDSSALRHLTAESLRQRGFDVTCAGGGAEALATIERAPDDFDVIVTDFAMPLVSGVDVIHFARSLRADWPAVIITGYADAEQIADRPADVPLLGKPFRDKDLLESIFTAIANSERQAVKAG
jgi:CheY-like chemotaxis protein